jgi:hypothetical protein
MVFLSRDGFQEMKGVRENLERFSGQSERLNQSGRDG